MSHANHSAPVIAHPSSQPAPSPVVAIPQWIAAIVLTATVGVVVMGAQQLARLRDNDTLITEKVRVLEANSAAYTQVLQMLGALGAKVDVLLSEREQSRQQPPR